MRLEPGDTFDEFRVLRHVGSGAFSEVFLAHDTILNRKVILKQLSPDLSASDSEWNAFVHEARITSSFFHPGIITVHALRIDSMVGSAVLVLEYMDSGTLADLIEQEGPLNVGAMWRLAYQIGNALHYLHERGIIHRDIKPENILYSRETEWFKLTDFGLAFHPQYPEFEALNEGQPGTLIYMSPEQTRHEKMLTERSDLYTFATVLYQALTGEYYLPLDPHNSKPEVIADAIQHDDPKPLPLVHHNTRLVDRLETVLLKGLEKRAKLRYPTVRRFIQAFTRTIEAMEKDQNRNAAKV